MIMPPEKTVHPWVAHLRGLTALIKARNEKTGRHFPGIGLSVPLDSSLRRSNRANYHDSPIDRWFLDPSRHNERTIYYDFVRQDALKPGSVVNGQSITASLHDLILRTQPILQKAPSLINDSHHPGAKADVQRLSNAAASQLSSFRAWPTRLPDYWQPIPVHHQIDATELSQLDYFPGRIDAYSDC